MHGSEVAWSGIDPAAGDSWGVAVFRHSGKVSWCRADPFWHGGPSRVVAAAIFAYTMTDQSGRRYWRPN